MSTLKGCRRKANGKYMCNYSVIMDEVIPSGETKEMKNIRGNRARELNLKVKAC